MFMEKFFKLKENGTTVRTEFRAGLTTFFAMVYILMVNANMFANPFGDGTEALGVSYGAIYIATAISAIIGTILIGLLANLPLAQASGMGLNAFFVYTVCVGSVSYTHLDVYKRQVFNFFDKKEQEVFSAFLKRRKATARRCFPARRR